MFVCRIGKQLPMVACTKRIRVNQEFCIACGLCRIHCQVQHSQSREIIKALKRETPLPLARLRVERNQETSFPVQCRHCEEPWCIYFCVAGAIGKDSETGIVVIDQQKCIGCWTCIAACPYGAIIPDFNSKTVVKCDLCPGEDIPACVANCPNEALVVDRDTQRSNRG